MRTNTPCFPTASNILALPSGSGIFAAAPTDRIAHSKRRYALCREHSAVCCQQPVSWPACSSLQTGLTHVLNKLLGERSRILTGMESFDPSKQILLWQPSKNLTIIVLIIKIRDTWQGRISSACRVTRHSSSGRASITQPHKIAVGNLGDCYKNPISIFSIISSLWFTGQLSDIRCKPSRRPISTAPRIRSTQRSIPSLLLFRQRS